MDIVHFLQEFSDEATCRDFVEKAIWNDKPFCPKCFSTKYIDKGIVMDDMWLRLRCCNCRKCYSVSTDSFFYKIKIPAKQWLLLIYLMYIQPMFLQETRLLVCCFDKIYEASLIKLIEKRIEPLLKKDPQYLARFFKHLAVPKEIESSEKIYRFLIDNKNTE